MRPVLLSLKKEPRYPLDRRLNGSQSRLKQCEEVKFLILLVLALRRIQDGLKLLAIYNVGILASGYLRTCKVFTHKDAEQVLRVGRSCLTSSCVLSSNTNALFSFNINWFVDDIK